MIVLKALVVVMGFRADHKTLSHVFINVCFLEKSFAVYGNLNGFDGEWKLVVVKTLVSGNICRWFF